MRKRLSDLHKLHNCTDEELVQTGVYTITSKINGKMYVGSASQSVGISDAHLGFRSRFGHHVYCLVNNKHWNSYLQNHVNKYGIDDLKFEILETCKPELALGLERYWVNMLGTISNGFNLCFPDSTFLGKNHPAFKDLDEKLVIDMYCNKKLSTTQIAKHFNVSKIPVLRVLNSNNIIRTNHLSGINYEDLYKEYLSSNYTICELAKKYNIVGSTLVRGFKTRGFLNKIELVERDIFILYDRYLSGESIKDTLSKEYKINYTTINRIFDKYNLKKFNRDEKAKKYEKLRRLS